MLDAVVPNWRFDVTGAAAIAAEYGRWFAHAARLDDLRRHPTVSGEVVEYTLCWSENAVPHRARHVHVMELAPTGASRATTCGAAAVGRPICSRRSRRPAMLADVQAAALEELLARATRREPFLTADSKSGTPAGSI